MPGIELEYEPVVDFMACKLPASKAEKTQKEQQKKVSCVDLEQIARIRRYIRQRLSLSFPVLNDSVSETVNSKGDAGAAQESLYEVLVTLS